jgi:hypothetical protein
MLVRVTLYCHFSVVLLLQIVVSIISYFQCNIYSIHLFNNFVLLFFSSSSEGAAPNACPSSHSFLSSTRQFHHYSEPPRHSCCPSFPYFITLHQCKNMHRLAQSRLHVVLGSIFHDPSLSPHIEVS